MLIIFLSGTVGWFSNRPPSPLHWISIQSDSLWIQGKPLSSVFAADNQREKQREIDRQREWRMRRQKERRERENAEMTKRRDRTGTSSLPVLDSTFSCVVTRTNHALIHCEQKFQGMGELHFVQTCCLDSGPLKLGIRHK